MTKLRGIQLVGLIWLTVGFALVLQGVFLYLQVLKGESSLLLKTFPTMLVYAKHYLFFCLWIAALLGILKSFMLRRIAKKNVSRIWKLEEPLSITSIINGRFLILVGVMMSLGMLMAKLHVHPDVRGTIDIAIGIALFKGALDYFRFGVQLQNGYNLS